MIRSSAIFGGLTLIVFLIMAMIPGDPATAILGNFATPENVARLNAQLGLDKPLPQQYLIWLGNLLQGDLGRQLGPHLAKPPRELDRLGRAVLENRRIERQG